MRSIKTLIYLSITLAVAFAFMFVQPETSLAKSMTLKVSHQFARGDVRDEMGRVFGEMVTKRTNGEIKFRHYPAKSLYKPKEQWDAMRKGALDMSCFPLDYASGMIISAQDRTKTFLYPFFKVSSIDCTRSMLLLHQISRLSLCTISNVDGIKPCASIAAIRVYLADSENHFLSASPPEFLFPQALRRLDAFLSLCVSSINTTCRVSKTIAFKAFWYRVLSISLLCKADS